ncbi:hypothetical protein F5B18DRAFT_39001 [Nemania serpens]|nr:hypothetical protein F5B18DRAFT_39001 [Nemania serpens]
MAVPFLPVVFISLFITLYIAPVLSGVPRFGALDNANTNATLLPFDAAAAAGLAPRWFMEGTPALPAQLMSPNPRHLPRGHELGARQEDDDRPCAPGKHSCVEANSPGFCCPNDRYCYLDAQWVPKCCSLGVTCPGSLCNSNEIFCNRTSTSIITLTPTTTPGPQRGGSAVNVTSWASYTSFSACCARQCSATSFSCASAFGGQCCPFGFKCASGARCIEDVVPSTSTSVSTIVTEIPLGCTTSQIACAETDGGGCCGVGFVCTTQSLASATSTLVCAPNLTLADGGGSSGALSSGARAGIGVGVAVGAAIVIGIVTWLCIRQRRRPRSATPGSSASAHEMRGNAGADKATKQGAASWRAGRDAGQDDSLLPGPLTPWTDDSGPTSVVSGRGHSYFGPDAMVGPFTDVDGDGQVSYEARLATTPPTAGGDPLSYFHPNDILRPVEIGGAEAQRKNREAREAGQRVAQGQDTAKGPFELMGSPGSPSPLNSDEVSPPTDKRRFPPSSTDAGQKR